jgi:hypothetical protein
MAMSSTPATPARDEPAAKPPARRRAASSRFHAGQRDLSDADTKLVEELRDAYSEVEEVLGRLHGHGGASVSAALQRLHESYMWAMGDFAGLNAP